MQVYKNNIETHSVSHDLLNHFTTNLWIVLKVWLNEKHTFLHISSEKILKDIFRGEKQNK